MGKFIIYNLCHSCPVRSTWLAADNLKSVVFFPLSQILQTPLEREALLCDASLVPAAAAAAPPDVQGPPWTTSWSSAALHGSSLSFGEGVWGHWLLREGPGHWEQWPLCGRKAANTPARKLLRADPALYCFLLSASFAWTTANIAKLSRNTSIAWAIQVCGDGQQGAK